MKNIGGNTKGVIQVSTVSVNAIGEQVKAWADAITLTGFHDTVGGGTQYQTYNAKILESTDVFVCDFVKIPDTVRAENTRMLIDGLPYDVTHIDDPMKLHKHLEIYLKYTGGR